jgi:hypothetical protein
MAGNPGVAAENQLPSQEMDRRSSKENRHFTNYNRKTLESIAIPEDFCVVWLEEKGCSW